MPSITTSDQPEDRYAKASDFINKAELCEDAQEADVYWKLAISLAEDGLKNEPGKAQYNYLLGCVFHSKGVRENRIYPEVETYLTRYLQLKPDHEFSLCLLGFHLFDRHLYQQALSFLEKVDPDYFSRIDQEWRRLKILELRVSCRLYLNPAAVPLSDIQNLAEEYRRFPDMALVPMPLEIVMVLEHLIAEKKPLVALDQMLQEVFNMLVAIDQATPVARHATWVRLRLAATKYQRIGSSGSSNQSA